MIKSATSLSQKFDVHVFNRNRRNEFDFRTHSLHIPFKTGFLFYLFLNVNSLLKLLFKKTDIILAVDLDTIPATYIASKLKRVPIVYDAHEYYVESPELDQRQFVKSFWARIANFFLPKIKHNYTVCQSLVDILSKQYKQKYQLIINAPRKYHLPSTTDSKEKIILYQGVLNIGRGLEEMIEALLYIEGFKFHIAGDGDIKKVLMKLTEDLTLNDRVIFLGKLNPEELKLVTNEAWLGINLLDGSNKNYFYSLANKHLDYIQHELPSLSMDFPEYRRINEEYEVSILMKDLNPKAIASSIQELNNHPEKYQKLVSNCRKAKEIYSWENQEKELISFFENIS